MENRKEWGGMSGREKVKEREVNGRHGWGGMKERLTTEEGKRKGKEKKGRVEGGWDWGGRKGRGVGVEKKFIKEEFRKLKREKYPRINWKYTERPISY